MPMPITVICAAIKKRLDQVPAVAPAQDHAHQDENESDRPEHRRHVLERFFEPLLALLFDLAEAFEQHGLHRLLQRLCQRQSIDIRVHPPSMML